MSNEAEHLCMFQLAISSLWRACSNLLPIFVLGCLPFFPSWLEMFFICIGYALFVRCNLACISSPPHPPLVTLQCHLLLFTCYLLLSSHWTSCFWNMTGPPPPQGSALTPPSAQSVLPQKSTQLPSSNLCFKVTLVRPPRSPYLVLEHLLSIPSPSFIAFYFLKKLCIIEIFKHIQNEKE